MTEEQKLEWILARKRFYLYRGHTETDAMVLAQLDALEELGEMYEEDDHE